MDLNKTGEEADPLLAALHELTDRLEGTNPRNVPGTIHADIMDLPDAYLYIIDLPGISAGEILVELLDDSVLVISGERKRVEAEKYQLIQRWMGKLSRRFKLPENANADAVSAACDDGVLTVTVEKLPENANADAVSAACDDGALTVTVEKLPAPEQ